MTLTLTPSAIIAAMAGRPASVAGILIMTLGRSQRCQSSRAIRFVPSVSQAKAGETSILTYPSSPWVRS